jgi:hypothetical protein
VVTVKVPDHRSLIHSPLDAGKMVLSGRIGTINATSAGAAGVGAVRPPAWAPAAGLKRRVRGGEGEGVKRARWPPVIRPRRGLAVKARVQGGESEASRA